MVSNWHSVNVLDYIQGKLIPSFFSATKRYRFLSFAGSHPWDAEVSVYILQANIKISVRNVRKQIRKTVR